MCSRKQNASDALDILKYIDFQASGLSMHAFPLFTPLNFMIRLKRNVFDLIV